MEEHRSEKRLDQICACPELGEGMPSASRAVAHQCKHYPDLSQRDAGLTKGFVYGNMELALIAHCLAKIAAFPFIAPRCRLCSSSRNQVATGWVEGPGAGSAVSAGLGPRVLDGR
jgi:hypothetical protein